MLEKELIRRCKTGDRMAQKELYNRFAPKMLGVCRRYVKDLDAAEDVLVQAMYKVLTKLDKYSGNGSFEGWVRKISVNESLMYLRKQKMEFIDELPIHEATDDWDILDKMQADDILGILNQLPDGYRTVFNLFVVEGYKHREIAEKLGVSINTSKSQLILAKKRLKNILEKIGYR